MTTTTRTIAYRLVVTSDEFRTLQWLESRGYAARLVTDARNVIGPDDDGGQPETVTLEYYESDAWNATEGAKDDNGELSHDFGACAGRALLGKMIDFVDGII